MQEMLTYLHAVPAVGGLSGLGPNITDFVWRLTNGANLPVPQLKAQMQ